jgi:3-deoxy-7-phosphoheptulonate synthase
LIIEVHPDPDHASSDGAQSLEPGQFDRLMAELRIIAPAIGRRICVETQPIRGWAGTNEAPGRNGQGRAAGGWGG